MKNFYKRVIEKAIIEFPSWYGWNNVNSALFNYYKYEGRNLGITIFPLHFWKYFKYTKYGIGINKLGTRTCIGIGIFEIFWDSWKK